MNVSEAYEKVNLETLRPLAKFISPDAPTRKMDIVPYLIRAMTSEDVVRRLYDSLDEVPKAAIQEAVADPLGAINIDRFKAKYGQLPDEGTRDAPRRLSLFFPLGWSYPSGPASDPPEVRAGNRGPCRSTAPRNFPQRCRSKSRRGGFVTARSRNRFRSDSV